MVNDEVIGKASVAVERLSAHACPRTNKIVLGQSRNIRTGTTKEDCPAHRTAYLPRTHSPMLARHLSHPRIRDCAPEVSEPHVAPPISLQGQCQDSVRSDMDMASEPSSEMNSEKGILRVRDRIDETADEVSCAPVRSRSTRLGKG